MATKWFDDFLGIAYRYFDLHMNVVPLFRKKSEGQEMWQEIVHWWLDATIRIRFVEEGEKYWFIMGAESRRPDTNVAFYKVLAHSTHYERFKSGFGDVAYLRFGEYSKKRLDDVKDSDYCDCGHPAGDHADDHSTECLEDGCGCGEFASTQVHMLRRKKTVTDISFMDEADVRGDSLAWNCINSNPQGG